MLRKVVDKLANLLYNKDIVNKTYYIGGYTMTKNNRG